MHARRLSLIHEQGLTVKRPWISLIHCPCKMRFIFIPSFSFSVYPPSHCVSVSLQFSPSLPLFSPMSVSPTLPHCLSLPLSHSPPLSVSPPFNIPSRQQNLSPVFPPSTLLSLSPLSLSFPLAQHVLFKSHATFLFIHSVRCHRRLMTFLFYCSWSTVG